jgi:F-type H+-transporting ATPase subunit gamma
MSERLIEIEARITTARQFSLIAAALRASASLRCAEARASEVHLRAYGQTITQAIRIALAQTGGAVRPETMAATPSSLVIVLGAEQGFAGAFSEHVLAGAAPLLTKPGAELVLMGSRIKASARERGLSPVLEAPMPLRAEQASQVADELLEQLSRLINQRNNCEVHLVHACTGEGSTIDLHHFRLLPVDLSRFSSAPLPIEPILLSTPHDILDSLLEELVFIQISEAMVSSLAAENSARVRAMSTTQHRVGDMLDTLVAKARQTRQDEITHDVVDLASASLR